MNEDPPKATRPEPDSEKGAIQTVLSGTSAPPPTVPMRERPQKATGPESKAKKRIAANHLFLELYAKSLSLQPLHVQPEETISPGRPLLQSAKITITPWPFKIVGLEGNMFLNRNGTCSLVKDIDPQEQSLRVYTQTILHRNFWPRDL